VGESFDAIVIGMGPGGEVAASRLLTAGARVAVVERELIGGECAYWACIPSKTLLRPTEARAEADRAAGLDRPALSWEKLRDYRDHMIRYLDDSAQVDGYRTQGATVVKGSARLAGPGQVEVDGDRLTGEHIILATGSDAVRPPIAGLDEVETWTSREATTLADIPERAVLIGGSAVGIELGQFLARMGSRVTIVQRGERLLTREEPRLGHLVHDQLAADGIDVRLDVQARSARHMGADTVLELDDGGEVRTDVVVLGAGRTPRTSGLDLDAIGVRPGERGELTVDRQCRLGPGLWAVGDVTGVALFTHVAKYQGRVVADVILGRPRTADYTAVPRVVFAEPEIAAVGLPAEQARRQGIEVADIEVDLAGAIARPWTYETEPRGVLGLVADRRRRTLVGAWALAPLAGEWIHIAALAIRHRLPLQALTELVAQFPTYSEAYALAADQLLHQL
jgi:pyruvate/2-oxoglutarate dehydrogenase complex dihydrolipoamide dehydrogenase (E3) component